MKNKTIKKALSLVLAVVMTLSVFSYAPVNVHATGIDKTAVTKTETVEQAVVEQPTEDTTVDQAVVEQPAEDTTADQTVTEQPATETETTEPETSDPVVTTQTVEKTEVVTETVVEETVTDSTTNTTEPVEEQKVLQAQVDGLTFEVSGVFTADTVLEVVQLETDVNEYIHNDILALPELPEGYKGLSYDIKLVENGVEIQPTADVTVTVKDAETTAETDVFVFHMEGTSAEDIYSAYMADTGVQMLEANTAEEKVITGEQVENVTVGEGFYQFVTNSFSVYYVVSGTATDTNYSSVADLPSENSTYYMEPGAAIEFGSGNFTLSGTDVESISLSGNRTIVVSEDAVIGEQESYIVNNITLTFIVATKETVVNGALNATNYPIVLSVLQNGSNGIPNEPANTNNSFSIINSSYELETWATDFKSTAEGILKATIVDDMVGSVDGKSVAGVYDATGTNTLKHFEDGSIDWARVLQVMSNRTGWFSSGGVTATDGTVINSNNYESLKDNYTVIPYVVKLMSEGYVGWHIDCVVVPVNRITLSYDLNLKNYIITGTTLGLPNAVTSTTGSITDNVGAISGVEVGGTLSAKLDGDTYNVTFLGWSTDPNATEAEYLPGASISVTKDTVLYAVWTGKEEESVIKYEVVGPEGSGSVDRASESMKDVTGTAQGSTATANTNYEFVGWFTDEGCTKPVESSMVSGNKITPTKGDEEQWPALTTYYAKFVEEKAEINYVVAKGEGTVSTSSEDVDKVTGTATGSTATAGTNYVFEGWFDNEDCTGTPVSNSAEFVPTKAADAVWADSTTYYAKFVEKKVVINYVVAEGSGTVSPTSEQLNVVSGIASGSTATADENYEFVGWFDNEGTLVSNSAAFVPTKPGNAWVGATYYAKFVEKKAEINYVAVGGGTVNPTYEQVDKVTGEADGSLATPNTYYKFVGWYSDENCTVLVDTDTTFVPTKADDTVWPDVSTYYAKFERKTAIVNIIHYTENLDGTTWTAYAQSSETGLVGETYSESSITIAGFTYDSTIDDTLTSGQLTDDGLTLKLYYTRNSYPYQVQYLEQGTDKVLATAKDGEGKFEESVTENAIAIEDYTAVAPTTETIEIAIEGGTTAVVNVIKFYYTENEVTINYEAVGPTGATNFGTVDPTSETVKVLTGVAEGSTAEAGENYHFVGWYDNAQGEGEALSDELTFVPEKVEGKNVADTYYAIFAEDEVTINYVAVGPEGADNFGSVAPTSEKLKVLTGEATGSTATPNAPTFKFVAWYDADGNFITTEAEFIPTKAEGEAWVDGTTYYAKFEYNLTSMTISKVVEGEKYDDSNFVFTVTNNTTGEVMTLTIAAGETITVPNVTVGHNYTVTEDLAWSWRYEAVGDSSVTKSIVADASSNNFTITNKLKSNQQWLDTETKADNVFTGVTTN